jgi:hypothetical protein
VLDLADTVATVVAEAAAAALQGQDPAPRLLGVIVQGDQQHLMKQTVLRRLINKMRCNISMGIMENCRRLVSPRP